jgi:hypothetical protein
MWVLSCFVYFLCLRMVTRTFSLFRHCVSGPSPYPRSRIPIASLSHTQLLLDLLGLFIHYYFEMMANKGSETASRLDVRYLKNKLTPFVMHTAGKARTLTR